MVQRRAVNLLTGSPKGTSMSTEMREERLARRIAELYARDQQFADARPCEAISEAIDDPGLRLRDIVRTVMDGYTDRPALAQRAVQFVEDPKTGRTLLELLPRFETITYGESWDRVGALAAALASDPVRPGDRVCRAGLHQRRLHDPRPGADPRWRCGGSAADQRPGQSTAAHRRRDRTES